MSSFNLTKTRLFEGIWEGLLTRRDGTLEPDLSVTIQDQPVRGVAVTEDPARNGWVVRIPIPVEAVADGVQTFLVRDAHSGDLLTTISLIAGEALADDIRAEIDLLRAELDMLKKAFRRHCVETM